MIIDANERQVLVAREPVWRDGFDHEALFRRSETPQPTIAKFPSRLC
jgi:hypothetical protein